MRADCRRNERGSMSGPRVTAALAEIGRRERGAEAARGMTMTYGDTGIVTMPWVLDVLRGDRGVLERHPAAYRSRTIPASADEIELPPPFCAACRGGYDNEPAWPCPDAARVLNRYAPEEL